MTTFFLICATIGGTILICQFVLSLEAAWSAEDFLLRLSGSQTFQYSRHSLLRGRDPVPIR